MIRFLKRLDASTSRGVWQNSCKRLEGTCSKPGPPIPEVPGLSKKIVDVPEHEVGPGASKDGIYKNPEYFCYNNLSFFEAEIELKKFRLPQPSNKKILKD